MDETHALEQQRQPCADRQAAVAVLAAPVVREASSPPRFARAMDRDRASEELAAARFVVVEIEGVGPSARGRLGEIIDEAIERELRAHGAAGPGMVDLAAAGGATEREAVLGDQLYRARCAGAAGIAIVLGPLRAAARPGGALDPSDCAALRHLANASHERAFVLMLDARDATTGGYADPIPLERILEADLLAAHEPAGKPADADMAARKPADADMAAGKPVAAPPPAHGLGLAAALEAAAVHAVPAPSGGQGPARPREPSLPASRASLPDPPDGTGLGRDDGWRRWTLALAAARGPQALTALEKLFTESYTPLSAALASGLDDPRAKSAHDEFRSAFIRSYTDAFATFAATTKRPRMALDVHDIAGRTARLHGARSTRLLLVDAMRWDLSRAISDRLAAKLGSRAALTDELVLWSALPTKTTRQLETIARGVEALRAPAELDVESEPARGRTSEYIRRMRVGPRELHKLDLLEARIAAARGAVIPALPEMAESAAELIARHVDTLAPHTLLFVFGDHGFTVDRTGSAQQGGASPEEVLVGAFALLVGDVH